MPQDYQIGFLGCKIVGWVGVFFFLFCTIAAWLDGEQVASLCFIPFVGLSSVVLLMSRLKITTDSISTFSPFSEFRMEWYEIDRIEVSPQNAFVLHGLGRKRLVIPSTQFWSGSQKDSGLDYFIAEIERRQIEVTKNYWAEFKINKNVKR